MGCGDGKITYAMAALNPNINFIGVDKNRKAIKEAVNTYVADNLEFKVGDVSSDFLEPESVDAIINSYTLHKVFSNTRYNERIITDTLNKQFSMLKNNST
ncbi:MAG: methyltransferase domain-containing protein, partial [Sulfurovum sp.]|nr:methyltransferase domain-containing protein [Sulfurovum sp.]